MAKKNGLRTIAFGYRDYDIDTWNTIASEHNNFLRETDRHSLEEDLVFLAAFGLNDDLRDGVPEVIGKLYRGNVNVRMISGDNLETAIEVAKKAGIL